MYSIDTIKYYIYIADRIVPLLAIVGSFTLSQHGIYPSLCTLLLSGTTRYTRVILYFSLPQP